MVTTSTRHETMETNTKEQVNISTTGTLAFANHDIIPIANLNPSNSIPIDAAIKARVALVYPYSSSTETAAILVADLDVRARRNGGQIFVRLEGPAARVIGSSGIGIGDLIHLSLEGATWSVETNPIRTPAKRVDGSLLYTSRLQIHVLRDEAEVLSININQSSSRHAGATPPPSSNTSAIVTTISPLKTLPEWASPALPRYKNLSQPSLFGPLRHVPYTVSDHEFGLHDQPRKRTKFWRASGDWKYYSRSPSPPLRMAQTQNPPHSVANDVGNLEHSMTNDFKVGSDVCAFVAGQPNHHFHDHQAPLGLQDIEPSAAEPTSENTTNRGFDLYSASVPSNIYGTESQPLTSMIDEDSTAKNYNSSYLSQSVYGSEKHSDIALTPRLSSKVVNVEDGGNQPPSPRSSPPPSSFVPLDYSFSGIDQPFSTQRQKLGTRDAKDVVSHTEHNASTAHEELDPSSNQHQAIDTVEDPRLLSSDSTLKSLHFAGTDEATDDDSIAVPVKIQSNSSQSFQEHYLDFGYDGASYSRPPQLTNSYDSDPDRIPADDYHIGLPGEKDHSDPLDPLTGVVYDYDQPNVRVENPSLSPQKMREPSDVEPFTSSNRERDELETKQDALDPLVEPGPKLGKDIVPLADHEYNESKSVSLDRRLQFRNGEERDERRSILDVADISPQLGCNMQLDTQTNQRLPPESLDTYASQTQNSSEMDASLGGNSTVIARAHEPERSILSPEEHAGMPVASDSALHSMASITDVERADVAPNKRDEIIDEESTTKNPPDLLPDVIIDPSLMSSSPVAVNRQSASMFSPLLHSYDSTDQQLDFVRHNSENMEQHVALESRSNEDDVCKVNSNQAADRLQQMFHDLADGITETDENINECNTPPTPESKGFDNIDPIMLSSSSNSRTEVEESTLDLHNDRAVSKTTDVVMSKDRYILEGVSDHKSFFQETSQSIVIDPTLHTKVISSLVTHIPTLHDVNGYESNNDTGSTAESKSTAAFAPSTPYSSLPNFPPMAYLEGDVKSPISSHAQDASFPALSSPPSSHSFNQDVTQTLLQTESGVVCHNAVVSGDSRTEELGTERKSPIIDVTSEETQEKRNEKPNTTDSSIIFDKHLSPKLIRSQISNVPVVLSDWFDDKDDTLHQGVNPVSNMENMVLTTHADQAELSGKIEEVPPQRSQRRSTRVRKSNVPDVLSGWFESRNGQPETIMPGFKDDPRLDESELSVSSEHARLVEASEERNNTSSLVKQVISPDKVVQGSTSDSAIVEVDGGQRQAVAVDPSPNFRTPLSYFHALQNLMELLNSPSTSNDVIDIMAIVIWQSKKPKKSKGGPKDQYTILHVVQPPKLEDTTEVHVFRPNKDVLPVADKGDVILLRSFIVKSRKRECYLLSGNSSAWHVWRFHKTNDNLDEKLKPAWVSTLVDRDGSPLQETKGAPVEIGIEEQEHSRRLRSWYEEKQLQK